MVEKRAHEEGDAAQPESKRSRVDGDATNGSTAPGKANLASLDAIQKAKKVLELQKKLQEKLKALPQVAKPAGAAAAAAAAAATPAVPALSEAQRLALAAAARIGVQATHAAAAALAAPARPPPAAAASGAPRAPMVLGAAAPAAAAAAAPPPPPAAPPPVHGAPLPLAAAGAVPGVRPPGPTGFKAPILRLDAQGREVDEHGNPVQRAVQPVASLKVNQRGQQEAAAASQRQQAAAAQLQQQVEDDARAASFVDPRMTTKPAERRRRAGFDFVEAGSMQRAAELIRLRAAFGDGVVRRRGPALPLGPTERGDANLVPIGQRADLAPPPDEAEAVLKEKIPEVEWWDRPLLADGAYPAEDAPGPVPLRTARITLLIEHPVPLAPPAEAPPPPPAPLKLTKRELKKLRTQRRQAREKEKQELIRQGLLEPPKPKVKISNLMRVMGEQATADPTAVETEVRKQMAERSAAHTDRNLARMLTPAERREKKERKLFDDTGLETLTAVYRVGSLASGKHRFQVDVNAKENAMSGVMLVAPPFGLVVVEGCNKSLRRYNKLMLRRIDWAARADAAVDEEGDEAMHEEAEEQPPNSCHLVWQGTVKEASFRDFRRHEVASAEAARELLAQAGVAHYWDAAAAFEPADAPLVPL